MIGFQYSFGSYNKGYWIYEIQNENGKLYLVGEGHNGVELNGKSEVPADTLEHIESIINQYNIEKWNGFSKRNNSILDGYSFKVEATYEKGEIKADGYMMYPTNYEAGHEALYVYLDELAKTSGLS